MKTQAVRGLIAAAALTWTSLVGVASAPPDLRDALKALATIGREGLGNAEASKAWSRVAKAKPEELTGILRAMQGAGPLAQNWLRAAFDVAAQRALARGESLSVSELESFLLDVDHDPRARWLAFDWVKRLNAPHADELLVRLLNDPGADLRRAAVEQAIRRAAELKANGETDRAKESYLLSLQSARDPGQIDTLASALKDLGVEVDLPALFGWLTQWQVIGPFDNSGRTGFDRVFPPEERLKLDAAAGGKTGEVAWQPQTAKGDYGIVDLNPVLGTLKEVTGYATTVFIAPTAGPAEIRIGCKNAWKLWLNGEFIFGRDEYHRAMEIDQYRLPVQLSAGPNRLLLKICQNEEIEEWTKEWEFQLRITDPYGTPIAPRLPASSPANHANE